MDFSEKVNLLFTEQIREWDLAGTNYGLLSKVRTRKMDMGGFELILQFNPERIRSSVAKVDVKSIEERPCFLCPRNRPSEQKSLSFQGNLSVLVNPYPIFNRHLTIASEEHTDQRIAGNFGKMLDLAKELPEYLIFYNGPQCGASAPDHFHFQAGNRNFMPVEHDYILRRFTTSMCGQKGIEVWYWSGYLRGMITVEGDNIFKINDFFTEFYNKFSSIQPDKPEPMMNILAYFQTGKWIIHIIPRKLHRPSQFYANGNDQILLSPASVDLGGVFITPREEDFSRVTVNDIRDILSQVCMSDNEVLGLF
jgi:hypothetical protein